MDGAKGNKCKIEICQKSTNKQTNKKAYKLTNIDISAFSVADLFVLDLFIS